jgi:hypothetical protein
MFGYFRTYMFWLIAFLRHHEDTSFLSVLFCILYILFYVILICTVWKSSYIYIFMIPEDGNQPKHVRSKNINIFQIVHFVHLSGLLAPLLPLAFFVTHGYVFTNVTVFLI